MASKKMLINATQTEEVRVAIIEDQRLSDLDIESASKSQKKANIYKAKISRIEPSLNAIFVNYGSDKHGFLPIKEIAPTYFLKSIEYGQRPDIKSLLKEGQELIIQIDKDERGNKGAAVTTYITLAGCYLVLMPNNQGAGGVSRRVEGEDREQLKETLNGLHIPEGMGVIARTAGMGRSREELQWDLDALLKLWHAIEAAATERPAPFLIYEESDVILRSVRDYLKQDIIEIMVDNETAYNSVLQHVKRLRPDFVSRLRFHQGDVPLFTRYQIESQIETAYQREVTLPSGGSIVIDHTEALTSIDINSARATKGGDIEETALQTNLEAANEIARQLRLRDLGGLIVIDFIDMTSQKSQREVENQLSAALKSDRARVQIGRISQFGLLEMSRQRLRPSLGESSSSVCPRCSGQGKIRGVESLSLSVLRLIKEEAIKPGTIEIQVQLPVSVATYLLNEKRLLIQEIETLNKVRVTLIPNPHYETPRYDMQRIKAGEGGSGDSVQTASYNLVSTPASTSLPYTRQSSLTHEEPAIKEMPTEAAPVVKKSTLGVLRSFWKSLVSKQANDNVTPAKGKATNNRNSNRTNQNRNRRDNNRNDERREGRGPRNNRGGNRQDTRDNRQERPDTRPERQDTRQDRPERQDHRQERPDNRVDRQDNRNERRQQTAPVAAGQESHDNRRERQPREDRRPRQQQNRRGQNNRQPGNQTDANAPAVTQSPAAVTQAAPVVPVVDSHVPVNKISDMVHQVLNRSTALSADNATFVESKQAVNAPKHLPKQEVVQTTEFDAAAARGRLESHAAVKMVESKVSTADSTQNRKMDKDTQVIGQ